MRADARRNRRRLLDAAIELTLALGGEPSRDAVARRARVGIGTLYRHFPDQQALLRALVLDVLDRTIHIGHTALTESANGGEALRRYLHDAIDTGLGVVNVIYPLLDRTDWPERRSAAGEVLERLTDAARRDGVIGTAVRASDIAIASIRFCRPLAIGIDAGEEREIAHRHLDIYLDGLAANAN
ncbi:MAG: TetR/AcrR family transcriptional regulator [Nitriliruptoraceae bacterium]